jgi:hypothetical protein
MIDLGVWRETYITTKCLKNRFDEKTAQLSEEQYYANLAFTFPGFCQVHNLNDFQNLVTGWGNLQPADRKFLDFAIRGNTCALQNIGTFIQSPDFDGNRTPHYFLYLLVSPWGITAVDSMYIQMFINILFDYLNTELMFRLFRENPNVVSNMFQNPSQNGMELPEGIPQGILQGIREHSYDFLAEAILQDSMLWWLNNNSSDCEAMMKWNILHYKILYAFVYNNVDEIASSLSPPFSSDWQDVWNSIFERRMAGNPQGKENMLPFWSGFMNNMADLVNLLPDELPEIDPSATYSTEFLAEFKCEQRKC